jgi:phosphatidate cytidylyltransferase
MDDDVWRRERDEDDRRRRDDDFGEALFADDQPTAPVPETEGPALTFGESGGELPHWTEPPTGEVPRLFERDAPPASSADDGTDDLDVWSSFGSSEPAWRDDLVLDETSEEAGFEVGGNEPGFEPGYEPRVGFDEAAPRREPTRISIGTGLDEPVGRPMPRQRGGRPPRGPRPEGTRGPRPEGAARRRPPGGTSGRDMPTAVAVGLAIAAIFLAALLWKPVAVLAIVVLVAGLGAVELFDRLTDKGYQPATVVGIVACLAAPLAAYWVGDGGLPLVLAFAFLASAITFVGAGGLESAPLTNLAVTILGVTWIGLLGSYAALIVDLSNVPALEHVGTDTLFILAIGVVANDVGALFIGSAAGKTPLRPWISPNKSVEGLIGGTVATLVAVWLVGLQSDTWNDLPEVLLLGIVIAVLAPLGDLTESMFKRDLQVKDFGTVVRGHGGVLDRFDGFLFVLPGVYYLLLTLEPYAS